QWYSDRAFPLWRFCNFAEPPAGADKKPFARFASNVKVLRRLGGEVRAVHARRGRLIAGAAAAVIGAGCSGAVSAEDLQTAAGQAAGEAVVTQDDLREILDLLDQQKKKLAAQESALAEQQ